jgi:hypothetical protein
MEVRLAGRMFMHGHARGERPVLPRPLAGLPDAVITVDAMENIPPEDWPLVLGFRRENGWGYHHFLLRAGQ